jgi:hypothetical protein
MSELEALTSNFQDFFWSSSWKKSKSVLCGCAQSDVQLYDSRPKSLNKTYKIFLEICQISAADSTGTRCVNYPVKEDTTIYLHVYVSTGTGNWHNSTYIHTTYIHSCMCKTCINTYMYIHVNTRYIHIIFILEYYVIHSTC